MSVSEGRQPTTSGGESRTGAAPPAPDARRTWPLPQPYDFPETTRLLRTGGRDPTVRREPNGLWRSAHTDEGPATVRIVLHGEVRADAWGPGATRVLDDVPRWIGLTDGPWELPAHPVTDRLLRAHRGLRGTDTGDVFEALVCIVLQQLVTWEHAAATWRRLCTGFGEPAPGPPGLRLSPTPGAVRAAGTDRLQTTGMSFKQARTLMELARVERSIRAAADLPTPEASALLQKVPGVGPWTAAFVLGARLGRPEPVPVGDLHLPHTVAWALAREPRGSDERMLELLAPFEGSAFRVVRLIYAAGIRAPRRGPGRARRVR